MVTALLLAALLLVPARARADEVTAAPVPAPVRSARVEWSPTWRRFRLSEYIATPAIAALSLYVRRNLDPPVHQKWQGGNAFDDAIRDWLRADTREGRAQAVKVSDWLSLGGSAFPYVVDLPVVLLAHRQPQVAWQLLMMDLEANAVSGLISNFMFYAVGRGRPSTRDCALDPTYDPLCGGLGNNASFPSGHTQTIATAAGLTCVHHHYLPIYGSPVADVGGCVLMSLATLVTATTRIIADRHYATDILLGSVFGFGCGYGLPWLLHYRTPGDPDHLGEVASGRRFGLVPFGGPGRLGLAVIGAL